MSYLEFFALVYTFGPAAAIPYGLTFLDAWAIFFTLLICYMLPVPLLLHVLRKIDEKEDYKNRVINEAVFLTKKQIFEIRKISDQITRVFIEWWGDLGYNLALAFIAFSVGFIWAAVAAFIMKIPRKKAYMSIFFGTFAGLVFWFTVAITTIDVVSPLFFIILMLFFSLYSFIYAKMREKRIIPIIIEKVEKELKESKKKKKRSA